MGQSDDVGPELELLRGSQARLSPKQAGFVESIPVFLAEAPGLEGGDFRKKRIWNLRSIHPHKPTHFGIAFRISRSVTDPPKEAHRFLTALLEVQVVPSSDLDSTALGVSPFPVGVGWAMSRGIPALESTSVLLGGASFSGGRRRGAVKDAIPRDPQQPITEDLSRRLGKGGVAVTSVSQAHRRPWEKGNQSPELLLGDFRRSPFRIDPQSIQDVRPTAAPFWKEDEGGEAPSRSPRLGAGGQSVNGLGGPVSGGGEAGRNPAGIDPQDPPFSLRGRGSGRRDDLAQGRSSETPVLASGQDAGPPSTQEG